MATDVDVIWAYAADITKSDPTEDGHLMVHGKAASPTLDLDGQICDPAWLAQEMPDWFRWGNIRAQHGPVAAGVGKQLEADGADGWDLGALIVDTDSKEKVRTGVYKGFSVGIKGARTIKDASAPNGRIVAGKIVEISLVDRPCNPDAKMTLLKSAGSVKAFEDPGDPDSAVVEREILAPTDADGELVEPDDEQDEGLSDVVKGFIEFLRGPKAKKPAKGGDDRKRDRDGQFAAREGRVKDREARVREREAEVRGREADVRRAKQENDLSSEALADAENARRMGRTEEAGEHADAAASHARDRRSRQAVSVSRTRIGKAADTDSDEGEDAPVDRWEDASDEALEYVITKAAQVLAERYGEEGADIVKSLLPDVGAAPEPTLFELAAPEPVGAGEPVDFAPIISAEITKALQAQREAHEGELEALRAKLAKVEETLTKTAAPDPMAPVMVTQPMLAKSANVKADDVARVRRDAARTPDPAAQRALLAYAETLEAGQ